MLKQLALDCESARIAYDAARALPRTEHRIDGALAHATALALVQAWAAYDKATRS